MQRLDDVAPIIVPHKRDGHGFTEHNIPLGDDSDFLTITPLGAGQEVGRSCLHIKYKGRSVLLDCGNHPGRKNEHAQPYLDEIDLLLVTHFHIDHAANVPYLLTHTPFKGRCFMTHPTKSIFKLTTQDSLKVSRLNGARTMYSEKDLEDSMELIDTVDYYSDRQVNGIRHVHA